MYFMIKNPGLADQNAITLLGASTSRFDNRAIGTFGSGSKHSIALLLRNNIKPVITIGNLKMEFDTVPVTVGNRNFRQIIIYYSGKNIDGKSINRSEQLNITTEWGVSDWTKLDMALREFVANAIDGCIANGFDHTKVEMGTVQSPRACADHTCVFIPLEPAIVTAIKSLQNTFLHFDRPQELKTKFLNKSNPDTCKVYKSGVLVNESKKKSIFDYNLGRELTLDESRNATDWDVKNSIAAAIAKADSKTIAQILTGIVANPEVVEAKLDKWQLEIHVSQNKLSWFNAAKLAFGERAVATCGKGPIVDIISRKGFDPVTLPDTYVYVLEKCGWTTDKAILNGLELGGFSEVAATPQMIAARDEIWHILKSYDLTNNKLVPPVKAFAPIMDAEAQILGQYKDGTVYIHSDLGVGRSPALLKVMFEEIAHHVTGAGDMSRDFQDYLFRVLTKLVF